MEHGCPVHTCSDMASAARPPGRIQECASAAGRQHGSTWLAGLTCFCSSRSLFYRIRCGKVPLQLATGRLYHISASKKRPLIITRYLLLNIWLSHGHRPSGIEPPVHRHVLILIVAIIQLPLVSIKQVLTPFFILLASGRLRVCKKCSARSDSIFNPTQV